MATLFAFIAAQAVSSLAASRPALIEICTQHGVQLVPSEDGGGDPDTGSDPCLVCQSACSGALQTDAPGMHVGAFKPTVDSASPAQPVREMFFRDTRARDPPSMSSIA